jgi:hypothetical protein
VPLNSYDFLRAGMNTDILKMPLSSLSGEEVPREAI